MINHAFLFKSTPWVGEGTITLNMVEEELLFYTKWSVFSPQTDGKIQSAQEIQIAGVSENMHNDLTFFDFSDNGFSVEMENINVGKVIGKGVIDDKLIAWEFRRNDLNFEGFEIYYLQNDGSYRMHAEYVTTDQFRTNIDGRIWLPPLPKE